MIKLSARFGIDPQILLGIDFHEVIDYVKGLQEREREQYKVWLSLAYKVALWQRCDSKHFPKLEELLKDVDKETGKGQTANDMFNVVKALHARFGGK